MKEFPAYLKPNNKEVLKKILYERKMSYLRQMIYEHLLLNETDEGKKGEKRDKAFITKQTVKGVGADLGEIEGPMIDIIIAELTERGFKCELQVNKTLLYISGESKLTINFLE